MDVYPLIAPPKNCTTSCHAGAIPSAGLNLSLTPDQVRSQLVDVNATSCGPPAEVRVDGMNKNPAGSFFLLKIQCASAGTYPSCTACPVAGDHRSNHFTTQEIGTITTWIQQGAH
jgi:hypothetical protein